MLGVLEVVRTAPYKLSNLHYITILLWRGWAGVDPPPGQLYAPES